MLNMELNLDNDFFENPKMGSLRDGFGKALLDLAREYQDIVAVCADLAESTRMHWFKEEFEDRFFEVGITEQHMAAFASGLASMGKRPFISSYAMFSPGRNWEQIRTTICYNNQPVVIVGSHAGVSVGKDGGTHQALEDIAITRVIPNLAVFAPADENEAYLATKEAYKMNKPVYIRLARENTELISTQESNLSILDAQILFEAENPKLTIFATGTSVPQALRASLLLEQKGFAVRMLKVSSIKPLDEEAILDAVLDTKLALSVENHQASAGFGSRLAELFAENHPIKMKIMGVKDSFGQSGDPDELLEFYKLDANSIANEAEKFIKQNSL